MKRLKVVNIFLAGMCYFGFIFALFSQYIMQMNPCAWCILQRLIILVLAIIFTINIFCVKKTVVVLNYVLTSGLSIFGIYSAYEQHIAIINSFSCGISLAERIISYMKLDEYLPSIFLATANCADGAAKLLFIPYEFGSMGMFIFILLLSLISLYKFCVKK